MFDRIKTTLQSNNIFRIVFVGDSLTSTEWVHPNWREIVEYVLKQELEKCMDDWKIPSWNIRTINSGLDGATTRDIRDRLGDYVFQYNPQLVMLMIGGNDKYFVDRSETKEHLLAIMRALREKDISIALSTDPALQHTEHDKQDEDLRIIIRSIADEVDIFTDLHREMRSSTLEKFYTFVSESGNEVAGIKPGENDFLHPNVKGNAYMAMVYLRSVFGIEFDPDKYLRDVSKGVMFPSY